MEKPTAPTPTRRERLAAQRDAFVNWARTADTDDVPGDLGDGAPDGD